MPDYVPSDQVDFALEDGVPVVTLADTTCTVDGAWRVLNRLMLVVIDGPGDEGFLLQRRPQNHTDLAPSGWDDAVDRYGGVVVDVPAVPGRFRAELLEE